MAGRPFTLTNVMRGIKKHNLFGLINDPGCYAFLIELILHANELGFKNPLDLTIQQALAIGGGNNRQTLYNRRRKLSKIKLDGEWLVRVSRGDRNQNQLAKYEINYQKICAYNGAGQGVTDFMSNEIDKTLDMTLDMTFDKTFDMNLAHPKIREEKNREDILSSYIDSNMDNSKGDATLSEKEKKIISLFSKATGSLWRPNNDIMKETLAEVAEYPIEKIQEVVKRGANQKIPAKNILSWTIGGLQNYEKLYNNWNGQQPESSEAKTEKIKVEYTRLKEEYEAALKDTDESHYGGGRDNYLQQTKDRLDNLKSRLE